MTELDIIGVQSGINFAPANVLEEIAQNVRTILTTRKGSVWFDRDFGLDMSFLDQPMITAQAILSASVVQQLKKYEPRAVVLRVELINTVADAVNGKLTPKVKIGVIA